MSDYKKLYRSRDKKLCGVCGGIAEYFELDPVVMGHLHFRELFSWFDCLFDLCLGHATTALTRSHQMSDHVTEITWFVDFSPSLKTFETPYVYLISTYQ